MVAKAPLKLPTGVRAALTMTTSSDMDISCVEVFSTVRARMAGAALQTILLTEGWTVNWSEAKLRPQRTQNGTDVALHSTRLLPF
jgi:hypothetical protein